MAGIRISSSTGSRVNKDHTLVGYERINAPSLLGISEESL